MNPIRTNKPVFFGNDGQVLKNGYIYIGQPNQDPVPTANRKTVTFQDASGTQFTASQPLRTGVDGRIIYQATGKPIIALVDGNYSMLIQDENQVIIKNGYTPFVENDTSEDGSGSILYRSTLDELKAVNVLPGAYVENVGKITAEDGEGAKWLVVSNTGGSGDDVDLIDFDNGTQGKRVSNQLYAIKNLAEVDDASQSAQNIGALEASANLGDVASAATARSNLSVYSKAEADAKFIEDDNSKNIPIATAVFDGAASGDMLSGYGFSGREPKNDCTRNAAGNYTLQISLGNTPATSFVIDCDIFDTSLAANDLRDIRVVGISYNAADIRMEIDINISDGSVTLVDVEYFYVTVRL